MVWVVVYADKWANLRSACKKPEVLWRLAKLKIMRVIDWSKLVFWSSTDTRGKRRQSHS